MTDTLVFLSLALIPVLGVLLALARQRKPDGINEYDLLTDSERGDYYDGGEW